MSHCTYVKLAVKEFGRTRDQGSSEEICFRKDYPNELFNFVFNKRHDLSQWQKIVFYISGHAPLTLENISNEAHWKQEFRRIQGLVQDSQKDPISVCRCEMTLTIYHEKVHTPAATKASHGHARTLGVPLEDSTTVSVKVYKNGEVKSYKNFAETLYFKEKQRFSPDALYKFILKETPEVSEDQWRDIYLTVEDQTTRPKIRKTGDLQNKQEWISEIASIQKYLQKESIRSCLISLFIDTTETHAKNTAHVPAARHMRVSHATMHADLHKLLERLQAP